MGILTNSAVSLIETVTPFFRTALSGHVCDISDSAVGGNDMSATARGVRWEHADADLTQRNFSAASADGVF